MATLTASQRQATTPPNQDFSATGCLRISQAQKQALIDNLQLEVAERARKLRAQYAMQSQSLRTRIEMRVNRIPTALRNAKMGELIARQQNAIIRKQSESTSLASRDAMHRHTQGGFHTREVTTDSQFHSYDARSPRLVGKKRDSSALMTDRAYDDIITIHADSRVENPKKRSKANPPVAVNSSRHPGQSSTVLSPKSANARTVPRSPNKAVFATTASRYHTTAASPLKSSKLTASPAQGPKGRAKKGTVKNTGTVRGKKAMGHAEAKANMSTTEAGGQRTISAASKSSVMSSGTTILSGLKQKQSKADLSTKADFKKTTIASETAAPAAGRRTLRKR